MAETSAQIPNRDLFKSSEVCEIAQVQPYVLRSWEKEFPNLGTARSAGGTRVYRRSDVERVLQIRQLVFDEGLTLAGARKRLDGTPVPVVEDEPAFLDEGARARLVEIKRELRLLLDMLETRAPVAQEHVVDSQAEGPDPPESGMLWPPTEPAARRSARGRKARRVE